MERSSLVARAHARRAFAIVVLTALWTAVVPGAMPHASADPATRVVCPDGPPACAFDSIQDAISDSGEGDTVVVRPGTYGEVLNVGVAGLTLCSTSEDGDECAPSAATTIVDALASPRAGDALLTVSAAGVTIEGLTLDIRGDDDVASIVAGAPGLTLRDNVLVGDLRVAASLTDAVVDARLNDWQVYDWRVLGQKVDERGTRNRVLKIPFRLADGRAEPPLPVVEGSHGHSGDPDNCNNWDADGDGFSDAFHDGMSCLFTTVQAAIDFSHASSTVVVPASANATAPTPRLEVLHIDFNNHGKPWALGGPAGTITSTPPGLPPEALTGLTLCAATNTSDKDQPVNGTACATTDADKLIARRGTVIEGGVDPFVGNPLGPNPPAGDTVIDVAADDVTVQGLTIQWSGNPDTDFAPSANVVGVEVSGSRDEILQNTIRLQGGGCTVEDLIASGCYSPARTIGILAEQTDPVDFGDAPDVLIDGNLISADLPHPDGGTIGGTDGIRGEFPNGLISKNILTGWAATAVFVGGSGLDVTGNTFAVNNAGLKLCAKDWGEAMSADGNVFLSHFEATQLTNCGTGNDYGFSNNSLGLTNQVAMHVFGDDPMTGAVAVDPSRIDAECNDWGVYRSELIETRIADNRDPLTPGFEPVDFAPWTAPVGSDGDDLLCLIGPFARFTTDVHDPNDDDLPNSETAPGAPANTTRFHTVEFRDLSELAQDGRPIVSWQWNFGDGGMETITRAEATDGSTSHQYNTVSAPAGYTVTLTVTDADGLTNVASLVVVVTDCSTGDPVNTIEVPGVVGGFCTIQDAVDAASPGDLVLLKSGETYFENGIDVPVAGLTICQGNASMTACGSNPSDVVLDGLGAGPIVSVGAPGVTIEGMTLENGNTGLGDLVAGASGADGLTVSNAIFDTTLTAIKLDTSDDVSIIDSSFSGGTLSQLVILSSSADSLIEHNTFDGCSKCLQFLGSSGMDILGDNNFSGGTSSQLLILSPGDGATVDDNTFDGCATCIQVIGGTNPSIIDNDVDVTLNASTATHGIRVGGNTTGAKVVDNDVLGNLVPSSIAINVGDQTGLAGAASAPTVSLNDVQRSGTAIRLGTASGGLVKDNVILIPNRTQFSGQTLGITLFAGSGNTTRENTLQGAGIGLLVGGSTGARSENDVWSGTETGIEFRKSSGVVPTGFVARGGKLGGAETAVVFAGGLNEVANLIVDTRLNDWGVYDYRALPSRVRDDGTSNVALQIPFLLPDGSPEPGLPMVWGGTHSSTETGCTTNNDSDGDGVGDTEWSDPGNPAGTCLFLNVQAAINFSHANSDVVVPMSWNVDDPTPRFEKLTIGQNNQGTSLSGLRICSTTPRSTSCIEDGANGASWTLAGFAWGRAREGSGQALGATAIATMNTRVDTQIQNIETLEFDAFYEAASGCGGGAPRFTLTVDPDGLASTANSKNVFVYAGPLGSFSPCPTGRWVHHDLIDGAARWDASQLFGGWVRTQAEVASLLPAAHRVTRVFLDVDSPTNGPSWYDNIRFNSIALLEPGNLTCGSTPSVDPQCPQGTIAANSIIDATAIDATTTDVDAPNVTLDGFTVRRTAPPSTATGNVQGIDISGATSPDILRNAIRMEGGGCSAEGASSGACHAGLQTTGILAQPAASGALISGNLISGSPASSDATVGSTNGIFAALTGASVIDDNDVQGWGANGVSLAGGSGPIVRGNHLTGNGDGVYVCTPNTRVNDNVFAGHFGAILGCQTGTGLALRNNDLGTANDFGVRIPAGVSGLTIDARLNYWGVTDYRLLPLRVLDQNVPSTNRVLQVPFNSSP